MIATRALQWQYSPQPCQQWRSKLEQAGKDGGWSAKIISKEEFVEFDLTEHQNPIECDVMNAARRDYNKLKWNARYSKCRMGRT